MELLDGEYYILSKSCLKPFGLWPFQPTKSRFIFQSLTLAALLTVLIPHLIRAVELRHHFHNFLFCIPSILYYVHYLTKFYYMSARCKQFRYILYSAQNNFRLYKKANLAVLHKYAEEGRKFNVFYTMYLCSAVAMFNSTMFIPFTLDFLIPLNESRPRHPVRMVKYHVPVLDDSFYFILLHGLMFDVIAILIIIGFDTILINLAQHGCALFKIVVLELRSFGQMRERVKLVQATLEERQDIFYRKIVQVIVMHKHAIEFINEMESLYVFLNFFVLVIGLATITLTEFETIVHTEHLDIMARFAFFTTGQLINILYQNWPGQRIKDHGLNVNESIYTCEWYKEDISIRSRRLLLFLMMKSQQPCYLTAGKLFVLDLQNYVKVFKASLSYFAFLTNVQ